MIIHTIPAAKRDVPADKANSSAQNETSASANGKEHMPQSVSNVPRLISVVEIIKREYLKQLDAIHQDHGKLTGLYQYNEIADLPDSTEVSEENREEARVAALTNALQGKNQ